MDYKNSSNEDGWIPCNKRVPDEIGWYLVSREDGTVNTSFWFEEKTWKEGHNSKILAWQSLPKRFVPSVKKNF